MKTRILKNDYDVHVIEGIVELLEEVASGRQSRSLIHVALSVIKDDVNEIKGGKCEQNSTSENGS